MTDAREEEVPAAFFFSAPGPLAMRRSRFSANVRFNVCPKKITQVTFFCKGPHGSVCGPGEARVGEPTYVGTLREAQARARVPRRSLPAPARAIAPASAWQACLGRGLRLRPCDAQLILTGESLPQRSGKPPTFESFRLEEGARARFGCASYSGGGLQCALAPWDRHLRARLSFYDLS